MTTLDIKVEPDPVLRAVATPSNTPTQHMGLIGDMLRAMMAHQGLGLSAPQVGVSKRIIVARLSGRGILALINPDITKGKGKAVVTEGCLSVPGVTVDIPRFKQIKVVYTHPLDGIDRTLKLNGIDAAVIQHEVDHLDGKLIIDYK